MTLAIKSCKSNAIWFVIPGGTKLDGRYLYRYLFLPVPVRTVPVNPFELMRSGFAGGTPTTAPLLRRAAGAACLQRVRTPICSGATSAAASNFQQLAGVTAAVVRSGQGAAFWQLVIAFVCGGLFVTCSIGFLVLAYTYGATNVDRAKKMISLVVRRTVRGLRPCSAMCLHLACAHACDPVGTH